MTYLQTVPDIDVVTYKFVYQQSNLTSSTSTQSIFMFGMPPGYAVCMVKIVPIISFSGPSISSLTVQTGVSGNTNFYSPAFEITQSVNFQIGTPLTTYSANAHDVSALFTATGANINALTTGQTEITLQIRPIQ